MARRAAVLMLAVVMTMDRSAGRVMSGEFHFLFKVVFFCGFSGDFYFLFKAADKQEVVFFCGFSAS